MNELEVVKNRLYETKASLVVMYPDKVIKEYYQNRIKDIKDILLNNKDALTNAIIADKVIGKVPAAILIKAKVKMIYADVLSKKAIPLLEKYNIKYEYNKLVDYIENNNKDDMCPMEKKYLNTLDIDIIYNDLIK